MNRKRIKRKTQRPIEEIFSQEWTDVIRNGLKGIEDSELDKPQKPFSNMCKVAVAWKILGHIALEYVEPNLRSRIIADAEMVCNNRHLLDRGGRDSGSVPDEEACGMRWVVCQREVGKENRMPMSLPCAMTGHHYLFVVP